MTRSDGTDERVHRLREEVEMSLGEQRESSKDEPDAVSSRPMSSSFTKRRVVIGTPAGLPLANRLIRRFFSHS